MRKLFILTFFFSLTILKAPAQIYAGYPAIGIKVDTLNIFQPQVSNSSALQNLYLNCDTENNSNLFITSIFYTTGAGVAWRSSSYLIQLDSNIECGYGIIYLSTLPWTTPIVYGALRINQGILVSSSLAVWNTNDSILFNKNVHSPIITEYWSADFSLKYLPIRKKYENEYLYGWMLASSSTAPNGVYPRGNWIHQITKFPKLKVFYDTLSCGSSYTFADGNTVSNIKHDTVYDYAIPSTTIGCDSLVRTKINIPPSYLTTIYDTVCAGISYMFPDSSIISNTISDITHTSLFSILNGCDSVIISKIHVVDKTIYDTAWVCYGSSYTFPDGVLYNSITHNFYHVSNFNDVNGCDSNTITQIYIIPIAWPPINLTVCDQYFFNGQMLTASGIYYDTLINMNGCDSLITLELIISPVVLNNISASPNIICSQGNSNLSASVSAPLYCTPNFVPFSIFNCIDNFNFNGVINNTTNWTSDIYSFYNLTANVIAGNTYNFSIHNSGMGKRYIWIDFNRDGDFADSSELAFFSSANMNPVNGILTIPYNAYNGDVRMRVCTRTDNDINSCDIIYTNHSGEFEDYKLNISGGIPQCTWSPPTFLDTVYGNTVNAININTTTTYTVTAANGNGCIDTATFTLNVSSPTPSSLFETACNNYSFNGQLISSTGTYVDTLINSGGCDSIITLQLTVNLLSNDTLKMNICDGDMLTFNSNSYSTSGYYINNFINTLNCDSIITIHLTVNPKPIPPLVFNGTLLSTNGGYLNYTWYQNSVMLASNLDSSFLVPTDGIFNVSVIDSNGCSGISDSLIVNGLPTSNIKSNQFEILVYPNPASVFLNILVKNKLLCNATFILYDLSGRKILSKELNQKEEIKIPTHNISNGEYNYEFICDTKRINVGKVIFLHNSK